MRTKTEVKKKAILEEAAKLFQELGYEAASMAELCARVGGSKSTLYSYFPSKEELFFEVMLSQFEVDLVASFAPLDDAQLGCAAALTAYGNRFLSLNYRTEVIAGARLAIAESTRGDLGKRVYERAPLKARRRLAEFLATAMQSKHLRESEPMLAATQLIALLKAELDLEALLNVRSQPSATWIAAATDRAMDTFMRAYAI